MRGGIVLSSLFFFLLLLSQVQAATLSSTKCGGHVTENTYFAVTVSQDGAAYVGVDDGGIVGSGSGSSATMNIKLQGTYTHHLYAAYKNPGDSDWSYDTSASCDVTVDSYDYSPTWQLSAVPGTIEPGDSSTINYAAEDQNGIDTLELKYGGTVIQSHQCGGSNRCPTTGSFQYTKTYPSDGIYWYTVHEIDSDSNSASSYVKVTVTNPCENYNCDDSNPCTTDSCSVDSQGDPVCHHQNVDDLTPCPSGKCLSGQCVPMCDPTESERCLSSAPEHSVEVNKYCTLTTACYSCMGSPPVVD